MYLMQNSHKVVFKVRVSEIVHMPKIEGDLARDRSPAIPVVLAAASVGDCSHVLVDVVEKNDQVPIYFPPIVRAYVADITASV